MVSKLEILPNFFFKVFFKSQENATYQVAFLFKHALFLPLKQSANSIFLLLLCIVKTHKRARIP
jgi:hypothetical protein